MNPVPVRLAEKLAQLERDLTAVMAGHVAPEAFNGGPIAAVVEGDSILIDIEHRRIELEVPEATVKQRLAAWKAPKPRYKTGVFAKYAALVREVIDQNDELGDKDTADIFTEISRQVDKDLWFLEAPISIARAHLYREITLAPLDRPVADIMTVAKRALQRSIKAP